MLKEEEKCGFARGNGKKTEALYMKYYVVNGNHYHLIGQENVLSD